MKRTILSSITLLLTAMLVAQPGPNGPPKPPPLAERWKRDSIKLNLYIGPPATQMAAIKNVFFLFYTELDALAEKNKTAPPAREAIDKIRDNRKNALQGILTAAAFDRFETFEREFMPSPPPPPGRPETPEHLRRHEQIALPPAT